MAKTVIPVIVGLSLSFCGLAGAFYYYYLAKAKEDEEAIKTGKIEDSGKKMTFLVQNHQVPLIIGRNSKVIEKIEKDTTTKIKFEKKDDISHLCVIEGEMPEKVIEARDLIDQKRNGPHLETDEVFVGIENDKVALSGKAQEEIAKTTQAKIWIDPKNTRAGGTTRRVLVTGTRKQIDEAKTLIIERSKEPSPEADDSTPAQPINVVIPKGSTEKLDTIDQSGKQIDVYVSNVESPSKFYVQIVGSQTTNLDMLTHEMTDYYDINDNRKFHKLEEPSLGQIVAARFKLDDRW
jgi:tudor domain-containing protein 2